MHPNTLTTGTMASRALFNDVVNISGYRLASNGRTQEDNEQSSM